MHSRLKECGCRLFGAWVREHLSEYKTIRSAMKHSFLQRPAVLSEHRIDRQHASWIKFGALQGERHTFQLLVGWTLVGDKPIHVGAWQGGPFGDSGSIDLSDLRRLYGRSLDMSLTCSLELDAPPVALQEELLGRYIHSKAFEEDYLFSLEWEQRKGRPESEEHVKQAVISGKAAFLGSWGHILDNFDVNELYVESVVAPVASRATEVLIREGLPFIAARMAGRVS